MLTSTSCLKFGDGYIKNKPTLDQVAKSIEDVFPKGEDVGVEKTDKGIKITFQSGILFDTNKHNLKKKAKEYLKKFARIYVRKVEPHFKYRKLIIEGHTDNVGSKEYNKRLSEKRAKAVFNFLSFCIPKKDMEWVGKGESEPIADNKTEEGRAKNRRVELYLRLNPE